MTALNYIDHLEDIINKMEKTLTEIPDYTQGRYKMEAYIFTSQCLIDYIRSEVEELEVKS